MRPKNIHDRKNCAPKDTFLEMILSILPGGTSTIPELVKAIPWISRRSISAVASECRNRPSVLDVPPRPTCRRTPTEVSLSAGFQEIVRRFEGSVRSSKAEWARLLVACDELLKKEFISNEKVVGLSNNNDELGRFEGQFISNEKVVGLSNNNAPLEEVIDAKTPLGGSNFAASSIYKNKQQVLLFKELKEKANTIVKENQRSLNSTQCCADTVLAKQGQPTVSVVSEQTFSLKHNNPKTMISPQNNNGKRPTFSLEMNSFQIEGDAFQAIQSAMDSMSDDLVFMAVAKQSKPKLALVPKPEPVKETLTPEPDDQPTKPKRGRKAKEPSERKQRKSRHGESGSFPNSALPLYRGMSETMRHPLYDGKDSDTLDKLFARDYAEAIRKCDTNLPFYNVFTLASNTFAQLKASGYAHHIHKARLRADAFGARYEDYLEAIFESYWSIYEKFEGTPSPPPKYPQPKQLYGDKAQQYYEIWIGNQTNIPYRRYENYPEYLPENYTGKDYQINYYTKMMDAIRILCRYRHMHIHLILNDLICNKIMSREFAEDPDMNRILPGYKYSLAA